MKIQTKWVADGTVTATKASTAAPDADAVKVGNSADAGAEDTLAKSDHQHAVAAAVPIATGTANAAGSAPTFCHSDHVHKTANRLSLLMESARPVIERESGGPKVDGPFQDASDKRHYWLLEGFDTDDQVELTWRVQVLARYSAWPANFLRLDHLVNDAANVQITLKIYDIGGTERYSDALTVDAGSWQEEVIAKTGGTLSAGTWTVGEKFTIELIITMDSSKTAKVTVPQLYAAA